MRPLMVKMMSLTRATRTPENRATAALLPMTYV